MAASSSRVSFSNLPVELHQQIFSHLDPKDLHRISLVSRNCCDAARSVITQVIPFLKNDSLNDDRKKLQNGESQDWGRVYQNIQTHLHSLPLDALQAIESTPGLPFSETFKQQIIAAVSCLAACSKVRQIAADPGLPCNIANQKIERVMNQFLKRQHYQAVFEIFQFILFPCEAAAFERMVAQLPTVHLLELAEKRMRSLALERSPLSFDLLDFTRHIYPAIVERYVKLKETQKALDYVDRAFEEIQAKVSILPGDEVLADMRRWNRVVNQYPNLHFVMYGSVATREQYQLLKALKEKTDLYMTIIRNVSNCNDLQLIRRCVFAVSFECPDVKRKLFEHIQHKHREMIQMLKPRAVDQPGSSSSTSFSSPWDSDRRMRQRLH